MSNNERLTWDSELDSALRELAHAPYPAPLLAPGALVGPYIIAEPLGRGGMGVVYRAHDPRLGRDVALKVLLEYLSDDPRMHALLLREAQAAAAIVHPNVTTIFDVGVPAYIAMELISGRTLRQELAGGPLPLARALAYARQIALGLAAAHRAHIVHRDLKPENLMIDQSGALKILDFGLARGSSVGGGAHNSCEATTGRGGTLAYMSPEQAEGRIVDARTDVFAFGLVLAEMLGYQPLESGLDSARAAVLTVPKAVKPLVEACLALAPVDRPSDGAALVARLDRLLRRRRWWTWLAVGVLSVVVLVASMLSVAGRAPTNVLPPVSSAELGDSRQLTRNSIEASIGGAAISPDGKWIAYAEPRGIFIRTSGTFEPVAQLPEAENAVLAWFPDGRRLLVSIGGELAITSLDSGPPVRLGARGTWDAAVSPDGTRVVLVRLGALVVLDLATKAERELVRDTGLIGAAVAWSPSGRTIAFTPNNGPPHGATMLELVDVPSGRRSTIVHDPRLAWAGGSSAVTFSGPDRLVYSLARTMSEVASLQEMSFDPETLTPRGPSRRLANIASAGVIALSSTIDGRAIVHVGSSCQADVSVAELDLHRSMLGPLRRLTLSDADEHPSAFRADGRLLVVQETADGPRAIAVDMTTGLGVPVFRDERWMTWSASLPSGALGFRLDGAGTTAIDLSLVRGDSDGNTLQTRALGTIALRASARPAPYGIVLGCSADGAQCLLAHQRSAFGISWAREPDAEDALVIDSIDPTTLSITPRGEFVGALATFGAAISRRADRIAAVEASGSAYVILTADGARQTTRSVPDGCQAQFAEFTPDDDALVATLVCNAEPAYRLAHLRLGDASAVTLATSRTTWFGHPVLSPDGARLAISTTSWGGNVYITNVLR